MTTDLNQHFVESGENPQNFIVTNDIDLFPKIKQLRTLKDCNVNENRLHDPLWINADLRQLPLWPVLQTKFETIVVDPPWYEYYARAGAFPPKCDHNESTLPWSFEEIRDLRIEDIAASPGFCFVWCGNKHVEQATACLLKWGYRRIEDVCWIKTNNGKIATYPEYLPFGALNVLKNTKEHLLVGIKGTVQRSRDNYLLHANIDSDVIVAPEEDSFGCTKKPDAAYALIERFSNSQRRLELFGHAHNLRPGWVTIGSDISDHSTFEPHMYNQLTDGRNRFVPSSSEIERLRPKSPKSSYQNTSVPLPQNLPDSQ